MPRPRSIEELQELMKILLEEQSKKDCVTELKALMGEAEPHGIDMWIDDDNITLSADPPLIHFNTKIRIGKTFLNRGGQVTIGLDNMIFLEPEIVARELVWSVEEFDRFAEWDRCLFVSEALCDLFEMAPVKFDVRFPECRLERVEPAFYDRMYSAWEKSTIRNTGVED